LRVPRNILAASFQPVEDYLKLQGWFQHLFEPSVQTAVIAHIQERANAYWAQVKSRNSGLTVLSV